MKEIKPPPCQCCFCKHRRGEIQVKFEKNKKKKKTKAGVRNPNVKLTLINVKRIIAMRDTYKTEYIAKKFGVHQQTIYQIWSGLIWKEALEEDRLEREGKTESSEGQANDSTIIDTTFTTQ
jgi:DNA invertase Pin-like site-specific DNA recombinase